METGIVAIGKLTLESGVVLEDVQLAYERTGRQDAPTVLVCHALAGNQHVVGTDTAPGWWSGLVGQGKSIDTNTVSVMSFNVLGGCDGSTGSLSIDPRTGEPYGGMFPELTIRDMVHAERKALTALGIDRLAAVIGGSLGGMRVLEWSILYADDVDVAIPIAMTPVSGAYEMGLHAIGHDEEPAFAKRCDANSDYTLLQAMNSHDIGRGRGGIENASCKIMAKVVTLAFTHDMIYSTEDIQAFTHLLSDSTYILVNAECGHAGFLTEFEKWGFVIKQSMEVAVCRQSKSLYSVSAL